MEDKMSKFCTECGQKLLNAAKFCSNCGSKQNLTDSDIATQVCVKDDISKNMNEKKLINHIIKICL